MARTSYAEYRRRALKAWRTKRSNASVLYRLPNCRDAMYPHGSLWHRAGQQAGWRTISSGLFLLTEIAKLLAALIADASVDQGGGKRRCVIDATPDHFSCD
jgi:hypothetical protein